MLCSLTIALSENMAKYKDFILTLDLHEKWDETTLTAHLISTSCAKNFGNRNLLTSCLFTESAGTNEQVFYFGNDLFTSSKSELEAAEVSTFAKKNLDCQVD